jgi:hypothetical protein
MDMQTDKPIDSMEMFVLPEVIQILGKPYHIIWKDKDWGEEHLGSVKLSDLKILLYTHQPEPEMRDTILHEIIHCVNSIADLGLKERQVSVISSLLLCVAKENPELFGWMIGNR